MVLPKPKASSSTISSPEELRIGQVDSRESLDPSSSSAPIPIMQVLDSSEPLVPTTTTSSTDVPVVVTHETPTSTESVTSSMSAVPGCSTSDGGFNTLQGVSGVMPESPTFTEASGSSPALKASGSSGRRVHLTAEEIKRQWNIRKVITTFQSLESAIEFAEERLIIPRTKMCDYHKTPMSLETSGQEQLGVFRCRKSTCRNKSVSRAKGTCFENVHLYLPQVFVIIYFFADGYSIQQTRKQALREEYEEVISTETVEDWFNYLRKAICVFEMEHEGKAKIGGPGKIDQIDKDNCKGNFKDLEFLWRQRIRINKLDPFEELLKCILYTYK